MHSNRFLLFPACALAFVPVTLALGVGAFADAPDVPGHAIIARAEGDTLVIWDATPEVAGIVRDKVPDAAAKLQLERDALNELVVSQPKLSKVTAFNVRVVYTKTGDVSPVYGTPTFAGVERYATLTMSTADAKSDKDKWKEAAVGTGPLPGWITFSVSGDLPPR